MFFKYRFKRNREREKNPQSYILRTSEMECNPDGMIIAADRMSAAIRIVDIDYFVSQ